ncbi:cell division protein ZapA [Microvirga sp. CF3062]|uniref:cell division protein ZapA n=1 Tax=Microvirga sp. CF3062 TaxID=3110182 RepID=UPI002E76D258|nr:cell division protein ZapA [Microvirga sp. CF3062]MEE1657555.1 cell division protein ZapA [Microvirga sp. CF3062]
MSQVTVTIAGRTYRIACAEGEERHLEGLAASYNAQVEEMRATFGQVDDLRLHVMAAISQADELQETRKRITALAEEVSMLNSVHIYRDERLEQLEAKLSEGIQRAAERIEELARSLNGAGQG